MCSIERLLETGCVFVLQKLSVLYVCLLICYINTVLQFAVDHVWNRLHR